MAWHGLWLESDLDLFFLQTSFCVFSDFLPSVFFAGLVAVAPLGPIFLKVQGSSKL